MCQLEWIFDVIVVYMMGSMAVVNYASFDYLLAARNHIGCQDVSIPEMSVFERGTKRLTYASVQSRW